MTKKPDPFPHPPLGGVFITGTDTNVGKTVVTAALGVAFQRQGYRVGVMKPVETGTSLASPDHPTDGSRLHRLLSLIHPRDSITPYQFSDPVAPLTASRQAHQPIDFACIRKRYEELSKDCDVFLVEGVGGVLVPLTEHQTVRDLIKLLNLPCLVISRVTLGAVNHTNLTIEVLREHGVKVLAVVLNQPAPLPRSEIENLQIESTIQLIRELSGVPVIGPFPSQPLLSIDWIQGIMTLVDNPVMTQLMRILQKTYSSAPEGSVPDSRN